jgi:cysteine desulfurase
MNKKIYLDNNATTPLHPAVKAAMRDAFEIFGNPSSLHASGRQARNLIEEARTTVAKFINANPEEIIFTGSGTEANNIALNTVTCPKSVKYHHLLISTIEHPAVLEFGNFLPKKNMQISFLPVDNYGKVKIDELYDLLKNEKIGMVSVMMANNEIGTIQDIKTIAKIVHNHGALFHTDAVQAVGKLPVDVKDLDVDYLAFSGHKLYGPKGIGVLYLKKDAPYCPLLHGGHQEQGKRPGTENTLAIIGLAKAIEMRSIEMAADEQRLTELTAMLKQGFIANIPDIQFNGHPTDCIPGTLNVSFAGAEGEATLLYLDLEGIEVSTGSACASGSLDPSHVLLACGLSAEYAHGSIRFSLGRETTKAEIEKVLVVMPKIIAKIRAMSSVYVRGEAK